MASTCISTCIYDIKVPIRATNAYKWPESDAEFVRSLSSNGGSRGGHAHPTVVDSISCRQMYLRSYKFHRSDDHQTEPEQTKCFGTVKMEKVKSPSRQKKPQNVAKKTKCVALKRAKVVSCAALLAVFRRLLFCTTKLDVADHGG
ncbi:hypothetical protein E1A91_A03G051100v1 [Gossypium mustelinum]|uniref:Uncharacterized protein n=1 Tax=Gossypium mustelinum TaxID=34275 RepID=A0A5D2ZSQ0_GOSMU|nr:hypothetical protein E1A91_A03G051100v1 [Gossypium mustelinum]